MAHDNDIRVTYLITTRNRAPYLERTLSNVREFITGQDELIIIDGASTDNTAEVVERNKDIVDVFVSEPDCGEAHAFNKGLFRSRGRYIKPITDDDYFYPDAMCLLIQKMEENPEIDAIQCGGEMWRIEDGETTFRSFRALPPECPPTPESIFDYASIGLGLILRRSAVERIGGVSSNYTSVDGDLMVRLIECKCVISYYDINLFKWFCRPHSGFLNRKAFQHDGILFDFRLGRWEVAFARPPESYVRTGLIKPGKVGESFVCGANVVSTVSRSRLRGTLSLLSSALRLARSAKNAFLSAFIAGRYQQGREAEYYIEHVWSRTLRTPKDPRISTESMSSLAREVPL